VARLQRLPQRDGPGDRALIRALLADIRADQIALHRADEKYQTVARPASSLLADAVQRVGFQMMVAYRIMRALRQRRVVFLAKVMSRVIRHLYAADIHWDAELAPGVIIVHGMGIAISHGARVGAGCVLFQNVTLGESIDPVTRLVGAPTLEGDVHVGPGASLLGPIVIGPGTKITASALLMQSVPAGSLVQTPRAEVRPRNLATTAGVLLASAVLACSGCRSATNDVAAPGQRARAEYRIVEAVFDGDQMLTWEDRGFAPRQIERGKPARLNFAHRAAWTLSRPSGAVVQGGDDDSPDGLVIRYQAPAELGDFVEVRLDSAKEDVFPRIAITSGHRLSLDNGYTEALVPMSELNPRNVPFDRVVLRANRDVGADWVLIDRIAFARTLREGTPNRTLAAGTEDAAAPATTAMALAAPARMAVQTKATHAVDCSARGRPINPLIYGIAYDPRLDAQDTFQWQLGPTARRWGGNPASRYNWELGNAWNTAQDWYYENGNYTGRPDYTYRRFLEADLDHGVKSALTVPMIGWVAKDTTSVSFPISVYGPQQSQDSYVPDAGNGLRADGSPIEPGPPTRTSVAAPPAFIGRWVQAIREQDHARGSRSVAMYILDNEPMLWNSTHRDVHPQPTSYDEILERTIAYGTAVREADPEATIAGPAEWGWPSYFFSAVDAKAGFGVHPDRRRHGDVPLLPWYLQRLREHEEKTGKKLLDVLDVHFYPEARGVKGRDGGTDPATAARRLRSTRALWDPTYTDESWIGEPVKLIPRMQEWIDKYHPGLGLSIGEWNFGAEKHMSGGLAVAEALGRFGQGGLRAAFYWTYPPENSPAFQAFRLYRNYDGKGGAFLGASVPTRGEKTVSLFASRGEDGRHLVLVALNLEPSQSATADIDIGTCGEAVARRTFRYATGDAGIVETAAAKDEGRVVHAALAPYSMNVLEIELASAPARPAAR
jgi:serine acetyltransferase